MKCFKIFLLVALAACNNAATNHAGDTATVKDQNSQTQVSNPADISGCYMQVIARDTIIANLQQNNSTVSGTLMFDNYEKDASKGSVTGSVDGDIIRLLYSFASEGMNSVMEV